MHSRVNTADMNSTACAPGCQGCEIQRSEQQLNDILGELSRVRTDIANEQMNRKKAEGERDEAQEAASIEADIADTFKRERDEAVRKCQSLELALEAALGGEKR